VGWKKGKGIDKNLKICYKRNIISTSNQNIKIRGDKNRGGKARSKNLLASQPATHSVGWGGEST
jgi:hypothetical protein